MIQHLINLIRKEEKKHGNTKTRIADVLAALFGEITEVKEKVLQGSVSIGIDENTITTESFTSAKVLNVGTAEAPVLSFSLPRGSDGKPGESIKGDKGDPLRFIDLTLEQKLELKGDLGEPLRFEDLTLEQKLELKGDPGDPAEVEFIVEFI